MSAMRSNNAPKTFWHRFEMACGTVRHKLYVNGQETPYFIDVASVRAHYSYGERIALWGAGMGEMVNRLIDGGGGYRIAAFLGSFKKIALAKHAAEQRALA